jgi:hypothetical protein
MSKLIYDRTQATYIESKDGSTITAFIPIKIERQGARKKIVLPSGTKIDDLNREHEQDATLLKALQRAHKWQNMLDSGEVKTITELAQKEKMASTSYVTKVLRLALLAPDIQEAIVNSTHPSSMSLAEFFKIKRLPRLRHEQRTLFGFTT